MINSLDNQKVKEVVKLHSRKNRKKTGKFILEGKNVIEEALALGVEIDVYTTDPNYEGILVSEAVMQKMSDTNTPQGLLGIASIPTTSFYKNEPVLICESIQDPGNLGTMLRTALAFGFKNIIVDRNTADVYSPKVVRSSKGAIFKLHIECVDNLFERIEQLKGISGFNVIGTSLDGTILSEMKIVPNCKIALVFGNESNGMSEEIKSLCNSNIKIEIDEIESLNVAVAAGILLYNFKWRWFYAKWLIF